MSQTVTISTASVPSSFCFTTWQSSWPELVSLISGTLIGNYTFNFGSGTPTAANRDKPWIRLNTDGTPDGLYVYKFGLWIRPHPTPPSDSERRLWVGTENALWSYDGGDGVDPGSVSPTAISGAMWEVDDNFAARFPVGPGTFTNAGSVGVGSTSTGSGVAGEDEHTLTVAELAAHYHNVPINRDTSSDTAESTFYNAGDSANQINWPSESVGGDQAHNNLPPFYGAYFIKRTGRVFYTV